MSIKKMNVIKAVTAVTPLQQQTTVCCCSGVTAVTAFITFIFLFVYWGTGMRLTCTIVAIAELWF